MTEVLFGQSYFLRFDPKLWEAYRAAHEDLTQSKLRLQSP